MHPTDRVWDNILMNVVKFSSCLTFPRTDGDQRVPVSQCEARHEEGDRQCQLHPCVLPAVVFSQLLSVTSGKCFVVNNDCEMFWLMKQRLCRNWSEHVATAGLLHSDFMIYLIQLIIKYIFYVNWLQHLGENILPILLVNYWVFGCNNVDLILQQISMTMYQDNSR